MVLEKKRISHIGGSFKMQRMSCVTAGTQLSQVVVHKNIMFHSFKSSCAVMVFAASVAMVGPVQAQTAGVLPQAQALVAQNQWQQAFRLLEPSEVQLAGDPVFDLAMGIAANGAEQYMRAILALERVLAVQPENAQAHAQLGRALFAVGDTVGARARLNDSKRLGATGQLIVAVDSIMQSIDRAEAVRQSSVRGYVDASLGHDSNANTAPTSPNVPVPALGGLVFVLEPSGVKTPSGFVTVGNGILTRYVVDPRWSLIGNLYGSLRKNASQHSEFDSERFSLQTGVNYREERDELTLVMSTDISRLNNTLARRQSGIAGEWTRRLDQYRQLSVFFQSFGLSHSDAQSARDARRRTLGANYAFTFRNDLTVYGGVYAGTEQVLRHDLPHLGHRFIGLRLGGQKPVTESVVAFGSMGYERRIHGADEPTFLTTRHDQQLNLGLGVHWVPEQFWRVTPQLSLAQGQSNIIINEYNKRVISVTVRREF